jgi:hypothetical protein
VSVRSVLNDHQRGLVSAAQKSVDKQGAYAEAVPGALANGTRTTVPSGSDVVLDPLRTWRTRARATYADLKALDKGSKHRSLALRVFAELDNALYHQVRSFKKDTADRPGEAKKAAAFFNDYAADFKKLRKELY